MANLLFVSSSLFGEASQSGKIATEFVDRWSVAHASTNVIRRVLSADSIPHLTLATFTAAATPADKRSAAETESAAFADTLIGELEAADVVVIAAPMYNLSIPSTLKAWIDHVARAGRTFRYSAAGPEGLLKGKKVFIVTGRGGIYSGDSPAKGFDFQEPYLRAALGLLGLTDISFIHVEGVAMGPDGLTTAQTRARTAIAGLLPTAEAA